MKPLLMTIACGFFLTSIATTASAKSSLNYEENYNWASRPTKIEKPVDIFYVHPTIYTGGEGMSKNMDVNDKNLRSFVQGLLKAQAGVYSPHGNLFAPYYRQQSGHEQDIYTATGKTSNGADYIFDDPSFQIGAKDVESAFSYYLEELNPEPRRPFIIAGHSQGTMTLINLMRKRFDDPELQKHLIAAYLIGYSVTDEDFRKYPWMKEAEGESDTGVIITYNTEGAGSTGSPVYVRGAKAINPLNWKKDGTVAKRSENKGSIFFDDGKGTVIAEEPAFCGAYVDTEKGVLIATDIKDRTKYGLNELGRYPEGVFHRYDYAFWWKNLRENVGKRTETYLKSRNLR